MIFLCGIHGNENAGVFAALDVLEKLRKRNTRFRGSAVAIAGNLPALHENKRYIDTDLNRIWSGERLFILRKGISDSETTISEFREQEEIFEVIKEECIRSSGPVFMIDLHTTSAESIPFIFISDTIRNREFVKKIPLPVILGVEEILDSTLLNFANHLGIVCFGLEAGSHYSVSSYENTVSVIWITLQRSDCIDGKGSWSIKHNYNYLRKAAGGITDYYQLRYRYGIAEDEQFVMKPGFVNFEDISKGQYLAESKKEKVFSPENGKILMPLYQKQGNDGFYIVRKINIIWIEISGILRKIDFTKWIRHLPGIYNLKNRKQILAIRKSSISEFIVNIMHLLGYHKTRRILKLVLFSRREYDLEPPDNYRFFFR